MNDDPSDDNVENLGDGALPEDEKPLAPKPIDSTEKANQRLRRQASASSVSEDSGKQHLIENGDIPYRALIGLQSIYPFSRYFQSLADKEHKESSNSSTRFKKHKENHSLLWRFCVVCDLVIIVLIWVLIFAGLTIAVYKTLIL